MNQFSTLAFVPIFKWGVSWRLSSGQAALLCPCAGGQGHLSWVWGGIQCPPKSLPGLGVTLCPSGLPDMTVQPLGPLAALGHHQLLPQPPKCAVPRCVIPRCPVMMAQPDGLRLATSGAEQSACSSVMPQFCEQSSLQSFPF